MLHLYSIRVVDFIKHVFVDHHVPILCYIVDNRRWLEALHQDLRNSVVEALKDAADFGTRNASKLNRERSVQFVEQHGGTIHEPTERELQPFRDAAEPIKEMY